MGADHAIKFIEYDIRALAKQLPFQLLKLVIFYGMESAHLEQAARIRNFVPVLGLKHV